MTSRFSCATVLSWIRSALIPVHLFARLGRMFLVAVAGALGAPPPKPPRHDDDVVQVEEDA